MASNSIGKVFVLTTFGESHGKAIGGIIDGCPPNIVVDIDFIKNELKRRKSSALFTTARSEPDDVVILSGVFEGKTTGAPIGFFIENKNFNSADYNNLSNVLRPSHADFVYRQKYGIYDYNGGGRASARAMASVVVAGAFAKLILKQIDVNINAYVSQVGDVQLDVNPSDVDLSSIESSQIFCPDAVVSSKMIDYLNEVKKQGDSVGAKVSCIIKNVPAGLGEPVFGKLNAELGMAMLSINAAKGFEIGSGFASVKMKGSEANDKFVFDGKKVHTTTNNSGGIQAGISNGENIYFNVAFKPIASIEKEQETINTENVPVNISIKGRHDVCVVPRAVVIVEAMAAITVADHYLRAKTIK